MKKHTYFRLFRMQDDIDLRAIPESENSHANQLEHTLIHCNSRQDVYCFDLSKNRNMTYASLAHFCRILTRQTIGFRSRIRTHRSESAAILHIQTVGVHAKINNIKTVECM